MANRKRPTKRMAANIGLWASVMINNLKLWLSGSLAALLAFLGLYAKYQSNRADKANERANIAESKLTSADKRIEVREKREEIEQDIAMGDEPYIDERMRDPYDRDESPKL